MTPITLTDCPTDPDYHLLQVALATGAWRGSGIVEPVATGWGRLLNVSPDVSDQVGRVAHDVTINDEEIGHLRPVEDMVCKVAQATGCVAWQANSDGPIPLNTNPSQACLQVERMAFSLSMAGVSLCDLGWLCAGWGLVYGLTHNEVTGIADTAKLNIHHRRATASPSRVLTKLTEFVRRAADHANAME